MKYLSAAAFKLFPTNQKQIFTGADNHNTQHKNKNENENEKKSSIPMNGTKRKMGDAKKKSIAAEWPIIKPKTNLRINRLKETDLFTVCFLSPKFFHYHSSNSDSSVLCCFNLFCSIFCIYV